MDAKSVLKSKTLWINLGMVVTAVGSVVTGQADPITAFAVVVPAVVNMILRIITKQPLDV